MAQELVEVLVEKQDALHLLERLEQILQPERLREFLLVGPVKTLQRRAAERFDSEGDSASGKWARLRDSTATIRTFHGYDGYHPINERTGGLRNFVTTNVGVTMADAGAATLVWPTNPAGDLFAKFNTAQRGKPATPPFGATKPRPVVAMDETDAELMMADLTQWFMDSLAGVYG